MTASLARVLGLCALGAILLAGGAAIADDRQDCLVLSFGPLDKTIPACDRLIASGKLDERALFDALMARARAFDWAQTYSFGHEVDPKVLRRSELADLDRAVGIARRLRLRDKSDEALRLALSARASVEAQLGRGERAVGDYSEAIGLAERPALLDLFGRSLAYERLGRLEPAIADMSTILRLFADDSNHASHFVRRAELYEAAGSTAVAIQDYRRAVALQPDHGAARKALKRLEADR
ncbi:MAG: tetratricopeptide repeat protein [Alphaproteobacteria bacterium]|jgi:tetratricopeptide (TPR) repeat protein|nr:tetratricopeptide repeat protein [Alphaproteobacteria bacterium]